MARKLKTLEQHNADARKFHHSLNDQSSKLNGIACPYCGEELYDSNPMMVLTSNPPQKNTHCSNNDCEYVGYRIS